MELVLFLGLIFLLPSPIFFYALGGPILLILYAASVVWAGWESKRLEFHRYRLGMIAGVYTTVFGCFYLWTICFPAFLYSRHRILRCKAEFRQRNEKSRGWLELLILCVMGPVILSPLIPSLMPDKTRANESTAVTLLWNYANAQESFRERDLAGVASNTSNTEGYCDNYRNLYYGKDQNGRTLSLISQSMADAFAGPAAGSATAGEHSDEPEPYHGYLYLEDPYLMEAGVWESHFALIGYPERADVTGRYIFWIDGKRTVMKSLVDQEEGSPRRLLRPDESPLSPECTRNWETL